MPAILLAFFSSYIPSKSQPKNIKIFSLKLNKCYKLN